MKRELNVWSLKADCDRDLILGTDLDYFQDHFVGRAMKGNWVAPSVEIIGKRKRVRDFVAWMSMAPVISNRAKDVLEPLILDCVELLPLIELKGRQYWAVNVTAVVSDCLDLERSRIVYSPSVQGKILDVSSVVLREEKIPSRPMFKLAEYVSEVFVTKPFIEAVIDGGLSGAAFTDPAISELQLIAAGKTINVIPGLPE